MTTPHIGARHLALTVVMLAGTQLGAQLPAPRTLPPTVQDCDYQRLIVAPPTADPLAAPWHTLWPAERWRALAPLVDAGGAAAALDSVRASLDRTAILVADTTPLARAQLARVREALDTARASVARLAAVSGRATFTPALETLRQVGPATFRIELRGGRATLFRDTDGPVTVDDATPQGTRRTVCWHAALARLVLDSTTVGARRAAAAVIGAKRERWKRYFERGYSQLPWELWLNSRRAVRAGTLEPPRGQLVVLHPSVAMVLTGPAARDVEARQAIAVELLGALRYRDDYREYRGASIAATFTQGLGTGIAPFVHFGPVAKLGWVVPLRRDATTGRRSSGALITVDLYRFLTDRRAQAEGVLGVLASRLARGP